LEEGKNIAEMGFEEAMKELEELVKVLEKGDLDLESSLEIYEQAVALRERCKHILDQSERRVQKIIQGPDGPETSAFQ